MTITRKGTGELSRAASTEPPDTRPPADAANREDTADATRRSHVPNDGSAAALAVEQARRAMLHEAPVRKRTRIGADVVCEALIEQGVDVFFGYPGGVVLPLYDVLGDYPELRHILVRHEQGGAHAADGYARATGRVGVCLGTSGPGATNLVTGIATAQLDSVPIVAITGNVPAALLGKDAFQEIDINGITLPMTKHNYLVRDADDLPRVFAEAFHIARTGRPGPVHIDITKDALQQETRAEHPTEAHLLAGLPGFRPTFDGHPRQLRLAAAEIARARRPMILAGHGVLHAGAWDDLLALAQKTQIPVAHTLLGIGVIDETQPLSYGYMGMHGWKHVNRAIQSADLLVAFGMRFDDRVTGNVRTYAPYARIVHVDIDPAEIGKNQMWMARYAGFRRPNSHISSGGLGTMGFSVPAAMGAALGRPDKETWAITGDGGFQMTFQELMTLVQDDIPVKIALLDNKKLGMIRQWQEIIYAGNYHSAHLLGPDYLKLADAFGIPGRKAAAPDEVDEAIRWAQAIDGPALVWFEIAEEQNVFPMMPAGKG